MKKIAILFYFTLLINVLSFAQTHIPDKNFANAIRQECPACIDGNDNLTVAASKLSILNVSNKSIMSIKGIEGFVNLGELICYNNQLTTLPGLPKSIYFLSCGFNQLKSLPILPPNLTYLDCTNNQLINLPTLPQSLASLDIGNNAFANLPTLPPNLTHLSCDDNQLINLPILPQGLTRLYCNNNKLVSLPTLPKGLISLYCYNNKLVNLPTLPQKLELLFCNNNNLINLPILSQSMTRLLCNNNQLVSLPTLPQNLLDLTCGNNQLASLPILPKKLFSLACGNNQLVSLPTLPQSLTYLFCEKNIKLSCINVFLPPKLIYIDASFTNVKCLPNKPAGMANHPLPICDATNSGTCFAFPKVTGNVFLDYNDDGIKNNEDVFVTNQTIEIKPYGYNLTNNQGDYFQFVDTSQAMTIKLKDNFVNFDIKPNERALKTTSSFAQSYDEQDFRLVPKQIIGDMEVSIVSSVQRPGFEGTLTLTYRNIGTTVLFGQIKLEKDPILTYLSAVPKENAINGHTIIWDYSDLKPFESRVITVRVKVPTTTPINTKLTNKMFASYNVLNNYYETEKVAELTTVVGSYDPNDKTASVKNLDPQDIIERKPITYTIRFQNTGNYHAERVEIQDTISSNFDLSTFKNIAISHPNCTVSFEKDRFKAGQPTVIKWTFEPIFLPDSTANEPASHGFVRFSIQPKQGLPIGTALDNKAYIYFDYNLPIITNTSTVKVEKTIKVKQIATEIPLKVYPNPSSDRLFVETSEDLNGELVLTNLLGQVIEYQSNNSIGATVFDLQHLPKGVYILTLKTEEGSVSRKVVRE